MYVYVCMYVCMYVCVCMGVGCCVLWGSDGIRDTLFKLVSTLSTNPNPNQYP